MYESGSGERFTLYTSRANLEAAQMRYASDARDGALFWADRGVGMGDAMRCSMRAMTHSPGPILAWGFVVALLLVLGSLPFLIALAIVLPILGHATWHLYRRVVAEPTPGEAA